jgi:hypothetical protein
MGHVVFITPNDGFDWLISSYCSFIAFPINLAPSQALPFPSDFLRTFQSSGRSCLHLFREFDSTHGQGLA